VGSRIEVGGDLHDLLGIPLVRGRLFTADDDRLEAPRVALVDQVAAERYWPGDDPIGQRIPGGGNEDDPPAEIVGVVGSVTYDGPGVEFPTLYFPSNRAPHFAIRSRYLVLRTVGDPGAAVGPIRDLVRALDPGQALAGTLTMEEIQGQALARPRFIMTLLGVFSGVALALGAIGIYGVISYGVALRAGEIGIRRALGAEEAEVMTMVLKEGLGLTGAGLVLGFAGAVAVTRILTGFLHEVSPSDPMTYLLVGAGVVLVALAATWLPARRAGGMDPLEALRAQ
jgi:hypothetical protein